VQLFLRCLLTAGGAAGAYLFILLGLRLFGKKEISQLSMMDFVFVLLVSGAVQNAMVDLENTMLGSACAAGTLFLLNGLIKWATYKSPKLSRLLQGQSVMLIYQGEVNKENLRKTRISMDELEEALREHGVRSADEVDLAVLEQDGHISVLSIDYQSRSKQKPDATNE